MPPSIPTPPKPKSKNLIWVALIVLLSIITLTVFQDYIFSKLQNTGFYISESLLYNTFWIFFIPIGIALIQLLKIIRPKGMVIRSITTLGLGAASTILHILLFAAFFVWVSKMVYSPPHRFSTILNSVLSNHFYIALIIYVIAPMVYQYFWEGKEIEHVVKAVEEKELMVKVGNSRKAIEISSIQLITTDRPYTAIYTQEEKYLQGETLRDFEYRLDPKEFLRVHKSAIVNRNFVKEMTSRKNGDYDVLLENGQAIRFSRHFRENWHELLH